MNLNPNIEYCDGVKFEGDRRAIVAFQIINGSGRRFFWSGNKNPYSVGRG